MRMPQGEMPVGPHPDLVVRGVGVGESLGCARRTESNSWGHCRCCVVVTLTVAQIHLAGVVIPTVGVAGP